MSEEIVEVRPFTNMDHAGVVLLWNIVFANDPPRNDPEQMIRRKMTVQPELFFVACLEDQIVGTVLAGFDGVRGWIYHLAVHPSARRQGTATRLMRAAEEELKGYGCPKINLQIRVDNAEVAAFYRTLGYAVEERLSMGKELTTTHGSARSRPLWIMIAGPYRSGSSDPEVWAANLNRLNDAAAAVFQKGHTPIIGVNLALPVIQSAGLNSYDDIVMPLSLRLTQRCDAVLRVGGPSIGADEEVETFRRRGLPVFRSLDEVPTPDR